MEKTVAVAATAPEFQLALVGAIVPLVLAHRPALFLIRVPRKKTRTKTSTCVKRGYTSFGPFAVRSMGKSWSSSKVRTSLTEQLGCRRPMKQLAPRIQLRLCLSRARPCATCQRQPDGEDDGDDEDGEDEEAGKGGGGGKGKGTKRKAAAMALPGIMTKDQVFEGDGGDKRRHSELGLQLRAYAGKWAKTLDPE